VADVLGIPENSIRVIPVECGGGFGRQDPGALRADHPRCWHRVTKRPVRYVMTRREELQAGMPARQVIIKLKTGVKRDGTLMALDAETVIDSGATPARCWPSGRGLPRQHGTSARPFRHREPRSADRTWGHRHAAEADRADGQHRAGYAPESMTVSASRAMRCRRA